MSWLFNVRIVLYGSTKFCQLFLVVWNSAADVFVVSFFLTQVSVWIPDGNRSHKVPFNRREETHNKNDLFGIDPLYLAKTDCTSQSIKEKWEGEKEKIIFQVVAITKMEVCI